MCAEDPNYETDASLVRQAKAGDGKALTALLRKHRSLVESLAARFFGSGMETEDLCQEGMLALLSAVYSFLPERSASFRTYAGVCVSNRLKTVVRQAAAPKNVPLNSYIPLDQVEIADDGDPVHKIISDESAAEILRFFQNDLSPLEHSVLNCFLKGCSYRETAAALGITEKGADNALQRIRSKLKRSMDKNRS